jgi:hypothetical protein
MIPAVAVDMLTFTMGASSLLTSDRCTALTALCLLRVREVVRHVPVTIAILMAALW